MVVKEKSNVLTQNLERNMGGTQSFLFIDGVRCMNGNIWSLCWRVLVSQTSRKHLCFLQSDNLFNISLPATSEGQIAPTAFGLV